ncbi:MAG: hypothetical protein FWC70_03260 [Defluviitaleaceae bacterium]|nr:hypothetical protein [Defluviitaleaceae bacterium]
MAQTNLEIRVAQKDKLFTLHRLKKRNAGITIVGLDDDIVEMEAKMEQEDVALVKEKITELSV